MNDLKDTLNSLPKEYQLLLQGILNSFKGTTLRQLYHAMIVNESDSFNAFTTELIHIKEGVFYFDNEEIFNALETDKEICSKWMQLLRNTLERISFSSRNISRIQRMVDLILNKSEKSGFIIWGIWATMERTLQEGNNNFTHKGDIIALNNFQYWI